MSRRSTTPLSARVPHRELILFAALLCPLCASAQSDPLAALNDALEKVVAKVSPAVVQVEATVPRQKESNEEDDADHPKAEFKPEHVLGSGVILDPSGYIVTNAHLVRGANALTVILGRNARHGPNEPLQGPTTLSARLVAEFEEADIAVLKVDAEGLPTISFSRMNNLRQGQLVIALGSPEGLQNSVTIGVVSSTERQITPDRHLAYVQTDAAINPGNSGGPLVDIKGDLVGINTFIITEGGGSEGLGFAIPSRLVQFVYESIRQGGSVAWGDTGAKVQGITHTLAMGLALPRESGVMVADVVPGTPAERQGIKVGDIIARLDGQPLESVPQYYETMYHKTVGQSIVMAVLRKSGLLELEVPIAAAPVDNEKTEALPGPAINLIPKLGVLCSELGARPRERDANLRSSAGVLVEAKAVGSDIRTNLRAGDVIRSVNLTAIYNVAELQSILDKITAGTPIVLQVERKERFLYLQVDTD